MIYFTSPQTFVVPATMAWGVIKWRNGSIIPLGVTDRLSRTTDLNNNNNEPLHITEYFQADNAQTIEAGLKVDDFVETAFLQHNFYGATTSHCVHEELLVFWYENIYRSLQI